MGRVDGHGTVITRSENPRLCLVFLARPQLVTALVAEKVLVMRPVSVGQDTQGVRVWSIRLDDGEGAAGGVSVHWEPVDLGTDNDSLWGIVRDGVRTDIGWHTVHPDRAGRDIGRGHHGSKAAEGESEG